MEILIVIGSLIATLLLTAWIKGRFFQPSRICIKKGHKKQTHRFRIRKETSGWWVVTDYMVSQDCCKRCKKQLSELYNEEYVTGYSGCSMPSYMWESIRKDGFVKIES
jgi:hypothetical protein